MQLDVNKLIVSNRKLLENIEKKDPVISSQTIVAETHSIMDNKPAAKIININLSPVNEVNDCVSESSSSSNHLAIYSNDNEAYEETQNSLLESIEINKMITEENIPKFETNVNDIISSEIDKIIDETSYEETMSRDEILEEILSDRSNKNGLEANNVVEEISNNVVEEENITLDENQLEKLKLSEIKKIAENLNIHITKKVNGQQKSKNKQELINDILQKN